MAFPWMRQPWQQLLAAFQAQRLSHAYYFKHAPEQGTGAFAGEFISLLMCRDPGKRACGVCKACLLRKAHNHPDIIEFKVDEKQSALGVDEVRRLTRFIHQTANQGGRRVIYLEVMDRMTEQAANAILKILEEPPKDVIWLLTVQQPERLMATLRSRMQWVHMSLPTQTSEGEYERAQQLIEAIDGRAPWPTLGAKHNVQQWLDTSEHVLTDIWRVKAAAPISQLRFADLYERYRSVVINGFRSLHPIEQKISQLRQLRRLSTHARGVNLAIILQNQWLTWTQEHAGDPAT
ncbi:DNA polymerase-3 subunit delta' [Idiomarina fontislapidosi]|uniref:DNA-directed DNA polymerase n=1 Tax=Idiomarina fontislapidosi TaxID=263723 RepID=A0A432Y9K0_9GAMM|nr:hypothetical protein [Idiomarina fontislapidosi]PYE34391.1 DNA polymerase-3 subunit delta' [Idiomarina fontislapidosi]RUO57650.1 hypothetical protein CWE25_04060 [Idiomarina fontislapidosi]